MSYLSIHILYAVKSREHQSHIFSMGNTQMSSKLMRDADSTGVTADLNSPRYISRAVARALIGGGGGGVYSYIRVLPDEFLLKLA